MKALTVVMMAVLSLSLAACGRKGSPQPPVDSVYPVHYPAGGDADDRWIVPRDAIDSDVPLQTPGRVSSP